MKRYSAEEKEKWIEDWRGSGKSAWAYARENGLAPQTLVNWTRAGERGSGASFVEVREEVKPEMTRRAEIRIERGDLRIYIPLEVGKEGLRVALEAIGGARCV